MGNTLTNLMPDLYEALDVVSREMVGFIPAVSLDAQAERAALNQTVRVPITPAAAAEDSTPGTTPPDTGDQVIGNTTLAITKSRVVPFRWTGEEQKGMNTGPGYMNLRAQQIAQAIRTLVNEVEVDLGSLYKLASRAYCNHATTPPATFATNLGDPAQVRKILTDNGCPMTDCQLVVDTTSGANLRTLAQLNKANEAGDVSMLRQGILLPLHGFDVRESAGVAQTVTVGTGSSYVINGAHAKGATDIVIKTGTGTVLAGDVITIGSDTTTKYVVKTGGTAAGTIVIGAPGLRKAAADGDAVVIVGAASRNMAFHRSAIVLATRAPALPEEGDMATDRTIVTDPRSGLSFEVAMYPQYKRVRYEVGLAWGYQNIKPAHTALLLGQ